MNPISTPAARRRSIVLWVFVVLALCLALPVLAALSWYVAGRVGDARAVRRLETQARAKGEPLTIAELVAAYPKIPDTENAALALIAVWKKDSPERWTAILENTRPIPEETPARFDESVPYLGKNGKVARGEPLSAEAREAARKLLAERADRIQGVRAALQKPKSRFPVRYEDGFAALYAHLAALKQEAQVFRLDSLLAAEEGRVDQSIADLGDAVALANLVKEEPALISHLVRIACLAIALDGVQELLSRQALTRAQLDRLESICQKTGNDGGFRQAMIGERASGLSVFGLSGGQLMALTQMDGAAASPFQSRGYQVGMKLMKISGLQAADRRCMMEVLGEMVALSEVEPPESVQRAEALDQGLARRFRSIPPPIFSRLLLPALSKSALKFATLEAQKRSALVAMAVERYRLDHNGALPASLATLSPQYLKEPPRDPYDGQPLRYATRPKGYVIYSVGADREDDDGQKRVPGQTKTRWDETFTVTR